jgi:hypothetical protein
MERAFGASRREIWLQPWCDDALVRSLGVWVVVFALSASCTGSSSSLEHAAAHLLTTRDLTADAANLQPKSGYSTGKDFGRLTKAELDPTGRGPSRAPDPNLASAELGVVRSWARPQEEFDAATSDAVVQVQSMYLEFPDAAAAADAVSSLKRAFAIDHDVKATGETTTLIPNNTARAGTDVHQWVVLHRVGRDLTIIEVAAVGAADRRDDLSQLLRAVVRRVG